MKLYGFPLSGNVHKVRLLLSALRLPYEEVTVDIPGGLHKQPAFLAINPRGQVPALEDNATRIVDAQAILSYLAQKYDAEGKWLPRKPEEACLVQQWLSFASNEIQNGPHLARIHALLGVPVPVEHVQAVSRGALTILEQHLARTGDWLELGRPTIADLACFPCVALAPDGKLDLAPYPHILKWIARIKQLPSYVAMPGLER
jgi:glutathione S-transferase